MTEIPEVFIVDRTERGRLRLTGRDRQSFLQGMVTNDIARLTPGHGCYAFQLDATGHVLADMRVLCLEEYLLLDVEPGMSAQVAATLEKYLIMERCRITDATDELAQVLIAGPAASALVEARFSLENTASWTEGMNAVVDGAVIAATMLISGPAFDVYAPVSEKSALLERLERSPHPPAPSPIPGGREVGEPELLPFPHPMGEGAGRWGPLVESLRIEAGVPRYGVDIDARVLALETGQRERAISFRKGCYIGQEIVARIDARGHTNRTFTGFVLEAGSPVPAPDTTITAGDDGREVGRVTSAAASPTMGRTLALGYIRREFAEPGTPVFIGGQAAEVAALPFQVGP